MPCLTIDVLCLHSKRTCRAGRGSTTDESQMVPCLRYSMPAVLHHLPPVCLRSTPVGAKRVVYTPFRSLLDKRSTFHFGRCWTRGLHSVPVVAGRVPPARSNTGTQQHRRLATQARSAVLYVSPTAQLALIPSCRQMSAHPAKRACPSVRPLAELS